jgi:hypothetical protein
MTSFFYNNYDGMLQTSMILSNISKGYREYMPKKKKRKEKFINCCFKP